MNVEAVVMSSGELESEVAGNPGYLIRKRYRAAADMSKSRGVMSCLLVNDIDAGLGRFEVRCLSGVRMRGCCGVVPVARSAQGWLSMRGGCRARSAR